MKGHCLHGLFLPAAFASNIWYLCGWTRGTEQMLEKHEKSVPCFGREEREREEKALLCLCFCVEMWRRYFDDREGWWRWRGVGGRH